LAVADSGFRLAPVFIVRKVTLKLIAFQPFHATRSAALTTEQELRQKLRKIAALFEGATTAGERHAAAAALGRVRAALSAAEKTEPAIEMNFRLPDRWNRRLFLALCRRYGLKPYRYPRQRYSTVVLRAPESFIHKTLWQEYLEIARALDEYLNEATEQIIRDEVFGDAGEAEERAETPGKQSSAIGFSLETES
jgi:hypothetical protein